MSLFDDLTTSEDLFNQNNNPTANKIKSYYSKDVQIKKGTQKSIILDCLRANGNMSHRELSDATGIARHLIPDRIIALKQSGLVRDAGDRQDLLTNKTVGTYEAV